MILNHVKMHFAKMAFDEFTYQKMKTRMYYETGVQEPHWPLVQTKRANRFPYTIPKKGGAHSGLIIPSRGIHQELPSHKGPSYSQHQCIFFPQWVDYSLEGDTSGTSFPRGSFFLKAKWYPSTDTPILTNNHLATGAAIITYKLFSEMSICPSWPK